MASSILCMDVKWCNGYKWISIIIGCIIQYTYTIIIYRLKGVIDTHVGFQTILQDVNGVMG